MTTPTALMSIASARALDELLRAITRTERALDAEGHKDTIFRRDVSACRSLLAGLYSCLPEEIIEEAINPPY